MNNPKKLVTEVFTSLAKGNVSNAEMNFSDDFRATVLNNPVDKKQYISAFTTLRKGIPDLQLSLHDVEESGNKIHAFLNLTGTHSQEIPSIVPGFKNLSPSGKKINAENVELEISLKDDKIKEIKNVKAGRGVFNEIYTQLSA